MPATIIQVRATVIAECGVVISGVVAHDVFLADCPARTTLALVSDTWSVIAVVALGRGPARYSELQQHIGGISKKMLTQTLRKLEANGLVERRALRMAPPGAEYRLTDLGRTLLEPVRALSQWAEEHTEDLLQAQDRTASAAGG
jgi:DNA-binding HxlR family transcriptional regulator